MVEFDDLIEWIKNHFKEQIENLEDDDETEFDLLIQNAESEIQDLEWRADEADELEDEKMELEDDLEEARDELNYLKNYATYLFDMKQFISYMKMENLYTPEMEKFLDYYMRCHNDSPC